MAFDRKAYSRARYLANREKILAKKKAEYEANPEKFREATRKYREDNPEALKETHKKFREKRYETRLEDNREYVKVKTNGNILKGDEWDTFFKEEAYELAKTRTSETQIQWHVDHIIPLRNTLVTGLHVWYNLQIIPARLNYDKSNFFEI